MMLASTEERECSDSLTLMAGMKCFNVVGPLSSVFPQCSVQEFAPVLNNQNNPSSFYAVINSYVAFCHLVHAYDDFRTLACFYDHLCSSVKRYSKTPTYLYGTGANMSMMSCIDAIPGAGYYGTKTVLCFPEKVSIAHKCLSEVS